MWWVYPVAYAGTVALDIWNRRQPSPEKVVHEVFRACNVGIRKSDKSITYPLFQQKSTKAGSTLLRLEYTLPTGLCLSDILHVQEELTTALNAEVEMEMRGKTLVMNLLREPIPTKTYYKLPEDWETRTKGMYLPIPIGYSRGGLEVYDLAEFPHLLIGGETRSGKSTFLVQMLAHLFWLNHAKIFVMDFKKTDFVFLKNHTILITNTDQAVDFLFWLREEMVKRQNFLSDRELVNIRELPPTELKMFPFYVLVIDEFSQLSPELAKQPAEKKKRQLAHQCLIDLICLSGSVGIHIVLAMQRPDRDICPGQLKANLPARLAFKTSTVSNSQIILDNSRAFYLPAIPGRAIFQYIHEREMQVMYLHPARCKQMLPPIETEITEMVFCDEYDERVDGAVLYADMFD